MASSIKELEITESMKNILKRMAEIRVCTADCESVEECHQRLLEDAERFKETYRKRGRKTLFDYYLIQIKVMILLQYLIRSGSNLV